MTVALMISALFALALSSGIALAAATPPEGDDAYGDLPRLQPQAFPRDRMGRR